MIIERMNQVIYIWAEGQLIGMILRPHRPVAYKQYCVAHWDRTEEWAVRRHDTNDWQTAKRFACTGQS